MSEELLQRDIIKNPDKIGSWNYYSIGATTINALKESGIIRSVDYGKIGRKKVDAIIIKPRHEVIAIIEYKHPKEFNTKKKQNKAIQQEIDVAKKLKTKLIIATDTKETVWINVDTGNSVKDKDGNEFKYNFNPKDANLQKVITEIIQSISDRNDRILPKELVNPTDLAKQIWQDVWSVSGATPENCLYTFVELFIFKYLSDLDILKGIYNFYNLMKMYEEDEENNNVLNYYANVIRPKIKALFPENPIDKTTIINGTIFVSKDQKAVDGYSTVFKKVLQKFNNYPKLEHIDYDFKSNLFESFLKESISKKNWGQFFTPIKVVRAINEMAKDELKEGMTICDPACGVGKFPLEFIKENIDKFFAIKNNKIKPTIKIIGFDKGFDKDEQKTIILAKANMLIYFCELIKDNVSLTEDFAKIFNESFILKTNSILGTLSEPTENEYDLILTNPPYVTSGSSNLKEEISKTGLKTHYKVNAMGVEGLFMEWIIRALKPNGKAFIVVPDGIFNRQNDKNLRQFILDTCYIDAIISLPEKTFFTTPKKTYILAITKKNDISEKQIEPVFTYLVSEIGESRDVYRFEIEQDDLKEAVNLYNAFKGSKGFFEKMIADKRCKIQPIDFFIQNVENNWIIDKQWDDKDKIDFGILEDKTPLSIQEFPYLLDEVANNIFTYKEELLELSPKGKVESSAVKKIAIGEIFDLPAIKGLTAKFIQKNQGEIPVYGGRKEEQAVGFINDNLKGVKYFDNCLAWNREGSVGYVFFHNHKFTTNDHHRPMALKPEYFKLIDLEYMKYEIQDVLLKQGFSWSKTASKEKVAKIKIKVPITKNGKFDLQKQKEIAERKMKIDELKENVKSELEKISKLDVDIK